MTNILLGGMGRSASCLFLPENSDVSSFEG